MISTRHPASAAPISFSDMASEYGSWPVEPAAHQILMLFRLARAFSTSGMIVSRKCSNGTLSRKKKVSLVVMASTTWAMIDDDPPFIFCTSSPMPGTPHLRDSGSRRLSIRYCLSADRSRPE